MPKKKPDSPAAAMARLRWAKTTEAERKKIARKMVEAKAAKRESVGPPKKRKGEQ